VSALLRQNNKQHTRPSLHIHMYALAHIFFLSLVVPFSGWETGDVDAHGAFEAIWPKNIVAASTERTCHKSVTHAANKELLFRARVKNSCRVRDIFLFSPAWCFPLWLVWTCRVWICEQKKILDIRLRMKMCSRTRINRAIEAKNTPSWVHKIVRSQTMAAREFKINSLNKWKVCLLVWK
jgi:hypothetical protein